jgi:hypothetical protein
LIFFTIKSGTQLLRRRGADAGFWERDVIDSYSGVFGKPEGEQSPGRQSTCPAHFLLMSLDNLCQMDGMIYGMGIERPLRNIRAEWLKW